ncbi:MAG: NADP-dependent phosphogluconate dehydrogenase [Balneolaceae bacterium]
MKTEFGLVGLGVMGKSLSRNLAQKGFSLSLFNRHVRNLEEDVAVKFINMFDELSNCKGYDRIHEFVLSLEKPRKIFLMIKAGEAIDQQLEELSTFLDSGDIIIDGGNSHYRDTLQRIEMLATRGIRFIGAGISGGESGALKGPSIMPGGDSDGYDQVKKYLEAIAAKDKNGESCCTYIGPQGSGHFVKMVHNGIEYAEMQLIAEVYSILRYGMGINPGQIANEFSSWGKTALNSYLLEITIQILKKKEKEDWLVDKILDKAVNKGTGSWTSIAAAELGVPIPTLTAALHARFLSFFKDERLAAHKLFNSNSSNQDAVINISTDHVKHAYQLARIINHHQGFHLLETASREYGWELKLPQIARIWTNGCIIRSELMETLSRILPENPHVLLHHKIQQAFTKGEKLNETVSTAIQADIHIPCLSSASNYLTGYTTAESSANIIQAQRDYFGAHTYKRIDDPEGKPHHTEW